MFSYRDAQRNDFQQISLFPQDEDELFFMFPRASYPLSETQMVECASQRLHPTVFLSDGKVAGYANIIKIEDNLYGSVGNIIIAPAYRGQGMGRYILDVMSQIINEQHQVKELRLACFSTNLSALILYEKYGFKPYDMELRIDNRQNTAVLIHLRKEI